MQFRELKIGEKFYLPESVGLGILKKASPRKAIVLDLSTQPKITMYANEEVLPAVNMAVHHIDGNPRNNDIANLQLVEIKREDRNA